MTFSKASSLVITQRSRSEYSSASPLAWDPQRHAAAIRSSAEQASTKRESTTLWSRTGPGPLTLGASQDRSPSARGRLCDERGRAPHFGLHASEIRGSNGLSDSAELEAPTGRYRF